MLLSITFIQDKNQKVTSSSGTLQNKAYRESPKSAKHLAGFSVSFDLQEKCAMERYPYTIQVLTEACGPWSVSGSYLFSNTES